MKRCFIGTATAASLLLAACASPPAGSGPASPRENAEQIDLAFAAVQAAVEAAVNSPLLASKPDVKAQIKASSDAAAAAVLAYHDAAANCLRDPIGGQVGSAPGKLCDVSAVTIAAAEAQTLVDQTGALTSAFSFRPVSTAAPQSASPATN